MAMSRTTLSYLESKRIFYRFVTYTQTDTQMIKDIAHIALNPLDMDKSVEFFQNVFGWKKAFELHHDNGDPWIVYMKICKGHFLELFYDGINDRDYAFDFKKTGYNHLCVTVGDIRKTLQEIYEKGYIDSPEPEIEKSKCKNLWLYDPDGNGIELQEYTPECTQMQSNEAPYEFGREGYVGIGHACFVCKDIEASLDFYCNKLGMKLEIADMEFGSVLTSVQTGKVDIILANFTVTPQRAEEVDFALPYMNVALGVVSPNAKVIETLDNWNADEQMIVISGTTAETYFTENYPDIPLQKYDTYANAKNAMENGNGVAWANDNTEVIAFALQNEGYTVGIPSLGSQDTIAPAVSKGNETLLNWLNGEIEALGAENFFHADYEATLVDTYGLDYEESLVVEGGIIK